MRFLYLLKTDYNAGVNNIDLSKINHFVLRKQHLTEDSRVDNVVQVTRDISGLHATGAKEPYLALFARMRNFVREELDNELYIKKSLGKIRCMRGTLYILTEEMIPATYAATKEMVEKLSRRYTEFRGISMNEYPVISRKILDLLKGREMTIAEIKKRMDTKLNLSAVMNLMCDQGLLVRVQSGDSWGARNYRYAVFKDYFKDVDLTKFSEIEALILLVANYLKSFGPATETDIAWWVSLSKAKIREALEKLGGQLAHLSISGLSGDFLILSSDLDLLKKAGVANEPTVNLLPTLDPYLMGYKQRDRYLNPEYFDRVFDRSGNATSTILVDGRIVGVWDYSDKAKPYLKILLFEEAKDDVLRQIYLKAQKIGKFISGDKVKIQRVSSMVPLAQRAAGAFMSPLKNSS